MADEVKKSAKVEEILNAVKGMTVLELADLVKAFEEEFGVSAAAPVAVAAAKALGAADSKTAEAAGPWPASRCERHLVPMEKSSSLPKVR